MRALDKKKPFLIRGKNQTRAVRQHVHEGLEEPGSDWSDNEIGKTKSYKNCAERINQTASQFAKMFGQRLVIRLFCRITHNFVKNYYLLSLPSLQKDQYHLVDLFATA